MWTIHASVSTNPKAVAPQAQQIVANPSKSESTYGDIPYQTIWGLIYLS